MTDFDLLEVCKLSDVPCSTGRSRRRQVVVPVPAVRADLDRLTEGWSMHHVPGPDVQADVVDVAARAVEDQVAGEQRLAARHHRAGGILSPGRARQGDASGCVSRLGEA